MKKETGVKGYSLLNVVLVFTIIIAIRGFLIDFSNTYTYGGVDLRNRVVGARLMLEGLDPYRFKWSEGYPDTLLDPIDNPLTPVNRVSVPPTVLMLHVPLAGIKYSIQRFLWLFAQWLLLLTSLFFLASSSGDKEKKKAIWATGLFISALPIWRFHVERGQIYILYVFLVSFSYWLSKRDWKHGLLAGGLVLGFTMALRPTIAVFSLPLIFQRKWKFLAGAATGLLVCLLLSVMLFGASVWSSYLDAMPYHAKANLGEINLDAYNPGYPPVVDGMNNLTSAMGIPYNNSSLQFVVSYFIKINLSSNAMISLALIVLMLACLYFYSNRHRRFSLSAIFLSGSVLLLLVEYFVPAIKSFYMEIVWILPASMAIIQKERLGEVDSRRIKPAFLLLFLGLFYNTVIYSNLHSLLISDYLIFLFFAIVSYCVNTAQPLERDSFSQAQAVSHSTLGNIVDGSEQG
ncbi:MAG: DUF2029 domain-containing protein [Actinobacteria bacterium]|nr:DUF2029 domain-containing protein [Actinomycetota bacterium]